MRTKLFFLTIVSIFNSNLIADEQGLGTELSFEAGSSYAVEQGSSWYIVPKFGINSIDDWSLVINGTEVTVGFDDGTNYGIGIGKKISNNFRLQLDWSHAENDINLLMVDGVGGTPQGLVDSFGGGTASATFEQSGLVVSGIWEFGQTERYQPYFGLGLGAINVELDVNATVDGTSINGDFSAWSVTYNIFAGMNIDLSPSVDISFDYRFMRIEAGDISDLDNHTIGLGLEFRF
jgi:opacity protein-like surface antigen